MATATKCVKCGQMKGFSKDRWEKNIAKYGSVEKMEQEYLCRDCRPKKEKVVKGTETVESIEETIKKLQEKKAALEAKVAQPEVTDTVEDDGSGMDAQDEDENEEAVA